MRAITVIGIVVLASTVALAQRDGRTHMGTAMLSGVVTTGVEAPQPVRRATVTLSGAEIAGERRVVTDDMGRFSFPNLPAGRYQVVAEKPAFVATHFGSPVPGRGPGRPIALVDAQKETIWVRLVRGAVLDGTVRDERGLPLASSQIQVQRPVVMSGETRWLPVSTGGRLVTTDEQGRYRVWGLPPGEYIVRASGPSGYVGGEMRMVTPEGVASAQRELDLRSRGQTAPTPPPVLPQVSFIGTFAPSTTDRGAAARFNLREGQEWQGADIVVQLGRSGRVAGVAVGPSGQPITNVSVAIVNTRDRTIWASPGMVRPAADGRFVLPSIGPGEYAFVGRGTDVAGASGNAMAWHTFTPFTMLGDDINNLQMAFLPGATVRGEVALVSGGTIPAAARVTVTQLDAIGPAAAATQSVAVAADGRFSLEGVPFGRVRVSATDLGALAVRSAMVGDVDVLDEPITLSSGQSVDVRVLVTSQPTVVTGMLQDHLGRPAPEYSVVLFSTDRSHWGRAPRRLTGLIRLDSQARYRVVGLPPGSYHLAAVTDAEPQTLTDPGFLEELAAQSITIVLGEGEQKTQDLRLASTRLRPT